MFWYRELEEATFRALEEAKRENAENTAENTANAGRIALKPSRAYKWPQYVEAKGKRLQWAKRRRFQWATGLLHPEGTGSKTRTQEGTENIIARMEMPAHKIEEAKRENASLREQIHRLTGKDESEIDQLSGSMENIKARLDIEQRRKNMLLDEMAQLKKRQDQRKDLESDVQCQELAEWLDNLLHAEAVDAPDEQVSGDVP